MEQNWNKTEKTMARLPKALRAELETAAAEQRLSVSEVIRRVLTDWAVARATSGPVQ